MSSPETHIVDYPPSERPSVVDSLFLTIRSLRDNGLQGLTRFQAEDMVSRWHEWSDQISFFVPVLEELGIDYLKVQPGQPMIDCKPGSNRYSIFDDYKSPEYMASVLQEFAPDVLTPSSCSADDFVRGRATLPLPFVFKDIASNRGVNKFLIEENRQKETLRKYLASMKRAQLQHYMLEQCIETPGELSASYRFTMTPTGSIIAVTVLSAGTRGESTPIDPKNVTTDLAPLNNPKGSYFLNSRSITSNANTRQQTIGLDFETRGFELATLNDDQLRILEELGIDPAVRKAPDAIAKAAKSIAVTLGPGIGMVIGIDILQEQGSNDPYFLEANSLPSAGNVNAAMSDSEPTITHADLRTIGFMRTVQDLAHA
jgi:hypothetical protein